MFILLKIPLILFLGTWDGFHELNMHAVTSVTTFKRMETVCNLQISKGEESKKL